MIALNTTGYEPFIDFLKAYSIIVVVFCHGFPWLNEVGYAVWGVQIPLFFLVQVFHCYKRAPKPINWDVMIKRIFMPFLVIQTIVFVVLASNGGGKSLFHC